MKSPLPRPVGREAALAQVLPRDATNAVEPARPTRSKLAVWQALVAAMREAADVIDGATTVAAARDLDVSTRAVLGPEALAALHARARELLARLTARLSHHLTSAEIKEVLFVLGIVLDEKIQRRLAPAEEHKWPLLQRSLFGVHDGGDLFYDLIDDRLRRVDASPLLFELCYFCLDDGFVGRHNRDPQKLASYRRKLAARIGGAVKPAHDEKTTAWQLPDTRGPARLYLLTGAFALAWTLACWCLW
ncbi:MAG TPA: DotU family type IV/VI secretion system protein [Polyangia bacterium]|nr:DotU family type IV/VI secretion system protein [Polyangia bacterium]